MSNAEWYAENNCDHGHCPHGCPHPQPLWVGAMFFGVLWFVNNLICGRCLFVDGDVTPMLPCTPEVCQ